MSTENAKTWPVDFVETVIFDGAPIRIASSNGQPYVALDDIQEGSGLPESSLDLWCLEQMGITPLQLTVKGQEETCRLVPLRKVSGWLNACTGIFLEPAHLAHLQGYIRHCDDVLWMKYLEFLVKDFEGKWHKPSSKPVSAMNEDELRAEMASLGQGILYHFDIFERKAGV